MIENDDSELSNVIFRCVIYKNSTRKVSICNITIKSVMSPKHTNNVIRKWKIKILPKSGKLFCYSSWNDYKITTMMVIISARCFSARQMYYRACGQLSWFRLLETVHQKWMTPFVANHKATYPISSLSLTYSDAAPTADGSRVIKISIMLLHRLQFLKMIYYYYSVQFYL